MPALNPGVKPYHFYFGPLCKELLRLFLKYSISGPLASSFFSDFLQFRILGTGNAPDDLLRINSRTMPGCGGTASAISMKRSTFFGRGWNKRFHPSDVKNGVQNILLKEGNVAKINYCLLQYLANIRCGFP